MFRHYIGRLAISISILFSATLIFIRAQSRDQQSIRDLYLSAACPQPCFLDVRPGISTVAEAMTNLDYDIKHTQLLEAEIQYQQNNQMRYQRVNWSGYLFYPLQGSGRIDLTTNSDNSDRVINALFVRPQMRLELGDIYTNLGAPESVKYGVWYHDLGTRTSLILHLQYDGGRVTFITQHLCPVDWNDFWHTPIVSVRYSQNALPLLTSSDIQSVRQIRDCRNIVRR